MPANDNINKDKLGREADAQSVLCVRGEVQRRTPTWLQDHETKLTRNAWHSLAYRPPGRPQQAVAKHNRVQCRPLANIDELTRVLIDACCTQLIDVKSGVTGQKSTNFITDVHESSIAAFNAPIGMWLHASLSSPHNPSPGIQQVSVYHPGKGSAKYCYEHLCLTVYSHISENTQPNFTQCFVHASCVRGSYFLCFLCFDAVVQVTWRKGVQLLRLSAKIFGPKTVATECSGTVVIISW